MCVCAYMHVLFCFCMSLIMWVLYICAIVFICIIYSEDLPLHIGSPAFPAQHLWGQQWTMNKWYSPHSSRQWSSLYQSSHNSHSHIQQPMYYSRNIIHYHKQPHPLLLLRVITLLHTHTQTLSLSHTHKHIHIFTYTNKHFMCSLWLEGIGLSSHTHKFPRNSIKWWSWRENPTQYIQCWPESMWIM